MPEKIDLSLILACYNDAEYLEESVKEIFKILDMTRLNYEIIFVYDCGTDDTLSVINKIEDKYKDIKRIKKIVHLKNEGRGKSVRDGIKISEGDVVGYIDVDLDVHPRHIPYMVSTIVNDGYDVATAFRYYKVTLSPLFMLRHILSHGYRFISRALLHEGLKDSESGYKFFKRDKVLPLINISRYDGWFWDTEIMMYCLYSGLKVKEIPCVFERRGDKKSSVRIIDTVIGYLVDLIQFKIYLLKRKEEVSGKFKG
ncbi:MAG: glycosyltransferase [Candidatus Omnitrophica bacterium]|nr:glycosyltransferase [Candidatus Omnitrophota bacterium]MCM8790577.1 glycosyltransferase [Candidatus Omnitrophota bacterium]